MMATRTMLPRFQISTGVPHGRCKKTCGAQWAAGWMCSVYEPFPVRTSLKSHRTGPLFAPIQRRRGPGRSLVSKTTDYPVIFLELGLLISASSACLRTISSSMRRRMLLAWRSRVKVDQRTEHNLHKRTDLHE
jgi:hypothetical protein